MVEIAEVSGSAKLRPHAHLLLRNTGKHRTIPPALSESRRGNHFAKEQDLWLSSIGIGTYWEIPPGTPMSDTPRGGARCATGRKRHRHRC